VRSRPDQAAARRKALDLITLSGIVLSVPPLLMPEVRLVATLAALIVIATLFLLRWVAERRPFPVTPFNGALLSWSFMVALGITITGYPELTLPKACGLVLGLALFWATAWLVRDRNGMAFGVLLLVALGIVLTLVGLFIVRIPEAKVPLVTGKLPLPPLSSALHLPNEPSYGFSANQLGGTLAFYLPLLLALSVGAFVQRRAVLMCIIVATLIPALGYALLLTQSRSAWAGAVMGSLVVFILWGAVTESQSWRVVLLTIGIAGFLAPAAAVWRIGPERVLQAWEEPQGVGALGNLSTLAFRKEVWQWALAAVQDFPLTGCGLGTFRQVVRVLYPIQVSPSYDIAHAHNIFLQVALDTGLPGLVAYLALLALAGGTGVQLARAAPNLRGVSVGIVGGLVGMHVFGLLDALAPGSKTTAVFWLALGLLAAGMRQQADQADLRD